MTGNKLKCIKHYLSYTDGPSHTQFVMWAQIKKGCGGSEVFCSDLYKGVQNDLTQYRI